MVFHPIFVHFPIAFYFLELVLLVFWMVKKEPRYSQFARFSCRIGYLFMLISLVAGWIDAGGFVPRVREHALWASSVAVLYTARLIYWQVIRLTERDSRVPPLQIAGAILGNILIAITAFEGGEMVYTSH